MDPKKKPGLFGDFSPVSTQQWEEKIIEDLKGADYEKKLVWNTPEGLKLKPYYRSEHLKNLGFVGSAPGEAPYVRGKKINHNEWIIREDIPEENLKKANALALKAIEKGAQAIGFNAANVESPAKLKTLLKGIDSAKTQIHLLHAKKYPVLFDWLKDIIEYKASKGSLDFDPLGYFLLYGSFYGEREENFSQAKTLINNAKANLPFYFVININAVHYNNAGAGVVQELAFALAQANEYLASLTDMDVSVDDITPRMQFTIAIGSNYFLEIAKLRAIKMLWAKIVEQYKPNNEESLQINLHTVTSQWNKSIYDPYVNMLRTTTEAMAAAIGGVDSLTVNPFDSSFRTPDEFSHRIARNQQIILKEEAYFNKVVDPAAGSYYIENLTDSIAQEAWKLFVETEQKGGFEKAVEEGFIKSSIEEVCQKRDMDIAMRKQVFVGTNLYPDASERVLERIKPTAKLSDLGGLRSYRGTQAFEALRLAVENHEKKGFATPKVFHFTYGNPAMRKARATFSSNFFGVGGYHIIDNIGFKTLEEGVEAALKSGAEFVVFCSSDEEYAEMAAAASRIKKESPKTQVVVAGYPKDLLDQLREAGVDHFIHLRTNVLETLTRFNEILDIA